MTGGSAMIKLLIHIVTVTVLALVISVLVFLLCIVFAEGDYGFKVIYRTVWWFCFIILTLINIFNWMSSGEK